MACRVGAVACINNWGAVPDFCQLVFQYQLVKPLFQHDLKVDNGVLLVDEFKFLYDNLPQAFDTFLIEAAYECIQR